jgi:ribonuclease III family protein
MGVESSDEASFSPAPLVSPLISLVLAACPPQSLGLSQGLSQLSPAALAYVGDAIYELYIRTRHLLPPKRIQVYHEQVVAQVRAESQAAYLRSLLPHLTDVELEVLKRGRNAAPRGPKRLSPEIYQQATSLETLLGYLYLTDQERLMALLSQLQPEPSG